MIAIGPGRDFGSSRPSDVLYLGGDRKDVPLIIIKLYIYFVEFSVFVFYFTI